MLLVASCAKSGAEMTVDLWRQWQAIDRLVQTDYPDSIPIILVHGWNGSEFTWPSATILKQLEDRLHRDIYYFTYRSGLLPERFPPLEVLEEQLERYLANFQKVDVIAHSMGGLLTRAYLLQHPDHPIRRIVFLSTPHFGTNAAKVLTEIANLGPLGNLQAEEMRPGSHFLWRLNEGGGEELKSVELLNVYVKSSTLAQSDLVVDEHSAYLPGHNNVAVEGGHHTLPRRMHEFDFIIQFLMDGTIPSLTNKPERTDLWVRIRDSRDHHVLRLYPSSVRRITPKGIPKSGTAGLSVCCKMPSDLFGMEGSTLIIENIQPGEKLVFIPRNGLANIELAVDSLLPSPRPVIFQELTATPSP
jgi:pimeloyl-ACP methyl ester carboxylesterase